MKDTLRDWTPSDRSIAYRDGDQEGCNRYDDDFNSSDRAYDHWINGGDFSDPNEHGRFH